LKPLVCTIVKRSFRTGCSFSSLLKEKTISALEKSIGTPSKNLSANLLFCVFVAAALLVWCLSWVQIIPVYAAANALGPFSCAGMAKLHAENVRASLQDDEEWEAAEGEAATGVIASPRPGSPRNSKK